MTDSRFDLLCLGEPLGEFNATRAESGAFLFPADPADGELSISVASYAHP